MTTTISRQDLQQPPKTGHRAVVAMPMPANTNVFLNPRHFMEPPVSIPIDTLNNNNNHNNNNNCHNTNIIIDHYQRQYANNNNSNGSLNTNTTTLLRTTTQPTTGVFNSTMRIFHSPSQVEGIENNLNNNSADGSGESGTPDSPDAGAPEIAAGTGKQKRRSLLSFKSFDFHIKSIYSGLRNVAGNKISQSQASSVGGVALAGVNGNCNGNMGDNTGPGIVNNRMPPYLKIEAVDTEEAENLLIDYPQSPYSSRRNSSHDDNRSSSQLLHINRYDMGGACRSQTSTPSPYYLSPYTIGESSGNIRRSSTSDIVSCKRSTNSTASSSRRPSTSDLLRKARERRGSEARMGRSVSHSGLPRGAFRRSVGVGRRTSMAF